MKKLSQSLEDYLYYLYKILKDKQKLTTTHLAQIMNVSKPSVTIALQKLAKEDFIKYIPYKPIEFTDKGLAKSLSIYERRNTIQVFLEKILDIPLHESIELSSKLEHTFQEDGYKKLEHFARFTLNCLIFEELWIAEKSLVIEETSNILHYCENCSKAEPCGLKNHIKTS